MQGPTSDASPAHLTVYYGIELIAAHIPGVAICYSRSFVEKQFATIFCLNLRIYRLNYSNPTPTSITNHVDTTVGRLDGNKLQNAVQ